MYPNAPTLFAFTIILAIAAISTAGFSVGLGHLRRDPDRDHDRGHPPLDPTRRALTGPPSPSPQPKESAQCGDPRHLSWPA